jgi:Flp pilus assembly pilin Flp
MRHFLLNQDGQDILEYSLLLAAVALAGAALLIGMGGVISGIWMISNSRLAAANSGS